MSVSAPLLLAALLFLASPSSAQPALAVSGVTLSEGFGLRETARLTFDRKKASSGGFIYAVPRASAADERAVRLSAAVLTAEGRALGVAAVLARRHNVAALALPGARWQAGALVVERPVFGPTVFRRGLALRPLEGFQERSLREGEVVTVDPARGLLLAYDPSSQAFELELAQALRAFDGLKDMQALLQWYDGRGSRGPDAALAARLVAELTERLAAGTAGLAEYSRLRLAVDAGLDPAGRRLTALAAGRAARRGLRELEDNLWDLAGEVQAAGSRTAVLRFSKRGDAASRAARLLARAAGRPELSRPVEEAAKRLRLAARRRLDRLGPAPASPRAALAAAGAELAPGVELPAALYERFISESGIAQTLADTASDASLGLALKARRLAAVFGSASLSPDSGAGRAIEALLPKAALFDVQGPDGARLHVPAARLLEAVRDVWALSWSAAALGSRERAGRALRPPVLRVSVFVPAEVSGLAYSRDPIGGSRRRAEVEAVYGEPDALISEDALGDEYALDPLGRDIAPELIADKSRRLDVDARTGVLRRSLVPPGLALSSCLSMGQAAQAARAARALDDLLGSGVRLTFAFSQGRLVARGWRLMPWRPEGIELSAQAIQGAARLGDSQH